MRNTNAGKKLLALLLSVMAVSSVAGFASCKDDDTDSSSSSSSSSSSTVKDDGEIKNAGFENDELKDSTVIGTSVTNWSRAVNSTTSGSALSSKSASGVIDTAETAWEELTKNKVSDIDKLTEAQAQSKWKDMSIRDKLEYYEAWEDNNDDDDKDVDDLSFYESFNIDAEDLPTLNMVNPRTHDWKSGAENKNTKILMLHNEYSNSTYKSMGTAQKYTSSSTVTIKAGTSAKFSVWVKTAELTTSTSTGEAQKQVGTGAYISITNTLGGNTLDPLVIENIDTENMTGLEDTNGWANYQFYLQSADYADTTFTIVLGLGKGGGSDRSGYVNGYAFFDDIEFTALTNTEYKAETDKLASNELFTVSHAVDADKRKVDASKNEAFKAYAIDYEGSASTKALDALTGTVVAPTTEQRNGKLYTAVPASEHPNNKDASTTNDVVTYQNLNVSTAGDKVGIFTPNDLKTVTDDKFVQAVYDKNFKDSEFVADEQNVLLLLSAYGASYTAKAPTVYTLDKDEYMGISFFVKTSDLSGNTGAGITLVNYTTKTAIASIDTTTLAGTDLDKDGKDDYEGWLQCFFFVSNETDENGLEFTLEFNYGPTTVIDTTEDSYYTGYAMFTAFEEYEFADEKAFKCAGSGTYAKVVSLVSNNTEADGNEGFDTTAGVPTNAIKDGFANPKNYKGVYSNSAYVNSKNTDTSVYTHTSAGLLNAEHEANYTELINKLATTMETIPTWSSVFGKDTTQPLVIYNETAGLPYGYIGTSKEFASASYSTVSLRVKSNTTTNVYLIDTADETRENTLSIGAKKTYWYNDDGDVCGKDPSASDFNEKRDVAFYLQPNGLYKVNTSWRDYTDAIDKNAYYANLGAYEKDEDGNLVTGENAVTYDYTDNWRDYGNDGIAFYFKDGKYYSSNDKSAVEVLGFATVSALKTRTDGFDKQNMQITVAPTNGEWVTVTFYIHTGESAKNYRLEVWCGDRAGAQNVEANTYAFFDVNDPGAVDEKFDSLIKQRKEQIKANAHAGVSYESVFSFYDTDKYLRYDATADKNGVGNSYTSYLSSAYTSGTAYLRYANDGEYELYANYDYMETAVSADVEEDEDTTTDDTTETTDETNVWLLASSISIAGVLLLAVISIIVRKVVTASRKKRGHKAVTITKKSKKK